jgi:hypothetical protein
MKAARIVIPKPKAEESAVCLIQQQIPRYARNDNHGRLKQFSFEIE